MLGWLIAFSLLAVPAFAQPAQRPPEPPSYVPFTIYEEDANKLRAYLDEQPMKFSLPILQWVQELEQRAVIEANAKKAQEEKAKADAKAKEQQPPDMKAKETPSNEQGHHDDHQ